ncbi:MAG: hypothetical protein WDO19_10755 [Bacteroidota bacterium]
MTRIEKITLIDPDLGPLEFSDILGKLTYSCQVKLPIFRKEVDIFFETDSKDRLPTNVQKRFLKQLFDNYDKILESITSAPLAEFQNMSKDKVRLLKEEFDLSTLGIPLEIENNPKWNLSLLNRMDKSMSLLSNFDNMIPTAVWIEKETKRSSFARLLLKLLNRK